MDIALRTTGFYVSALIIATDTTRIACRLVYAVHLARTVKDKGFQRSVGIFPPIDLFYGVVLDISYDTAKIAASRHFHPDIGMTAIDTCGILYKTYQTTNGATLVRLVHPSLDMTLCRTAVDGSKLVGVTIATHIAAEHSDIETLDVTVLRDADVSSLDVDVADMAPTGSKETIVKVVVTFTIPFDNHTRNGMPLAVEVALKRMVLVNANGNPHGGIAIDAIVLQIDVTKQFEVFAFIAVVTHVDIIGQLGQMLSLPDAVRTFLGTVATIEAVISFSDDMVEDPLPAISFYIVGRGRQLLLRCQE